MGKEMSTNEKHKLAAIVFTDIVGFTSTMEHSEKKALELINRKREILTPLVNTHNGNILKELGDGFLIMFDSSIDAVYCAKEIQESLKDEKDLNIRIGIHLGDVVIKKGDILGSGVNIASRIEPLASTGGICISEDVQRQIRNRTDINCISIGKKELKGVKHPIEIFELTDEEIHLTQRNKSILKELWQRRVPQIIALYLGACWAIIEFVGSLLVDRYLLSPHLIDFSIVTLLSLIPSILFLAYFHGKPGKDEWTKIEKIGIPINIILVIFILFFIFQNKDLGAVTKTVTIENEEGELLERVIPKSEFRKSMAIFPFENISTDSTLNWLHYEFSNMLQYDLSQDMFLWIESGYSFYDEMKETGFSKGIGLPLALKIKIADQHHLKYIVSGSFLKQNDQYIIKTLLHETKTCKLIVEHTFKGTDIFKLVDEMSLQLKYDLEIPKSHIKETRDLPVSEILTNSISALKMYNTGKNKIEFDNDFLKAQEYFEKSVKADPTFALAYFELQVSYIFSNQYEKREKVFQLLMQHLYKLPEFSQYKIKFLYYQYIKQDANKAFATLKMWVDLYPDNISGHSEIALIYRGRNLLDEAISEYKQILELDSEQYNYLQSIGSIYEQKGDFNESLKYYEKYAEQLPEDYNSYTTIGDLYRAMGDYHNAKSYYEKALIIKPEKISILVDLADIESKLGNFTKAFKEYEDALKFGNTPQDSSMVYDSLEEFYEMKGQLNKSFEYMLLSSSKLEKHGDPISKHINRLFNLKKYIKVGKKKDAFQVIQSVEAELEPPFDKLLHLAYLNIYLELEDIDNILKAIEGVEELIQIFQAELYRVPIYHAKGRINEIRGEYERAIQKYKDQLELDPTDTSVNKDIGRCYRKLEKFKEAKEYLEKVLKYFPNGPKTNFELALLYNDMDKKEKALEHLNITLEVWKDADPEYIPAQKAREKLKEWED
jgi:class 3 adenylate cyclase/tetratricopeptide (TPR) repeat protein/TolB-like protein